MASVVEICRMSLAHIGNDNFIESVTEQSKEAKICNTFFDIAKEAFLRDYNWNFASSRKALAEYGTAPEGYEYQYKFPNDCLHARKIVSEDINIEIPFKVANIDGIKVIQTDKEDAYLDYTVKITDVEVFDPAFVLALSYKLATLICTPLTSDKTRLDVVNTLYQNEKYNAQFADGNEGQSDEPADAVWIEART